MRRLWTPKSGAATCTQCAHAPACQYTAGAVPLRILIGTAAPHAMGDAFHQAAAARVIIGHAKSEVAGAGRGDAAIAHRDDGSSLHDRCPCHQ